MTENQAKKKWCPFARQVVSIQHADGSHIAIGSANRSDGGMLGMCVASACMAWRSYSSEMTPKSLGYCGLAGHQK